jgi:hypothetical protein
VAVDERPEIFGPAHAHVAFLQLFSRCEPRFSGVRDGKEVLAAGEVDDLAVVGGDTLRHAARVSQESFPRNRRLRLRARRVKGVT